MKLALGQFAAAAAACCAMSAGAATVTMNGSCAISCADLGLSPGGAVWATFELIGVLSANELVLKDAVSAFSVHFGNIAFTNDDLLNWDFAVLTDANGQAGGLQFLASFGTSTLIGDSIDLRENQWWTSHTGICSDGAVAIPCAWGGALLTSADFEFGSATFTVTQDAQAIPEPGSIALVGVALVGLLGTRRAAAAGCRQVGRTAELKT